MPTLHDTPALDVSEYPYAMNRDELKALFDQHAAGYDAQWAKTLPIRNCLHLLLDAMFAELPADA